MGCDIVATANHTLDTASIERLAADLAARVQARVKYGRKNENYDFVATGEAGDGERLLHLCSLNESSDSVGTIVYELYDGKDYEQYNIWIYRDCFQAFADYPSGRFGIFSDSFTGRYKYWDSELQYRQDVYAEALLLGGNTAIYHGDQCCAAFVSYDAETQSFATILNKVKALKNVVYIADWLRNFSGTYLQDDPEAFIDDFSYWPELSDIISECR